MALQIRRGTEAQRGAMTTPLAQGELIYTTDQKDLWAGDGVTNGGTQIAPVKSVNGLTGTVALTTDNVTQGNTNKYYSTSQAQIDAASALISGNGTNTGITFSYNSGTHTISAVVTAVGGLSSVQGDANPALGGTLSLNNHNINGTGNIGITGSITGTSLVSGNISVVNDVLLTAKPGPNITNVDSDNQFSFGSNSNPQTIWQYAIKNFAVQTGIVGTVDTPPNLVSRISRGTLASPSVIQQNDRMIKMFAQGYDGANFVTAGAFGMQVDTTDAVSSGFVPGVFGVVTIGTGGLQQMTFNSRGLLNVPKISVGDGTVDAPSIVFATDGGVDSGFYHPGDGIIVTTINGVERMRTDPGGVRVAGFIKVAQVSGTLPSPAEAGMIVLDGTTFKGYNGSAWVNLN